MPWVLGTDMSFHVIPPLMTGNVLPEKQGMAHGPLSSFGNRTLCEEWQNTVKVQGWRHALAMQVIPSTKPCWNMHLCRDKTTTYLEKQVKTGRSPCTQRLQGRSLIFVLSRESLQIPIIVKTNIRTHN